MSVPADRHLPYIAETLERSVEAMACLKALQSLDLNDSWIAAGFVRNCVWDRLHGFEIPTPLNDIDVLFFDRADLSWALETRIENALNALLPGRPFEVRNQARMHQKNNDAPYTSTKEALWHWLETPTAIAARLTRTGRLEFLHPHGTDDLMNMIARPTPYAENRLADYKTRMSRKNWPETWPKVQVFMSAASRIEPDT